MTNPFPPMSEERYAEIRAEIARELKEINDYNTLHYGGGKGSTLTEVEWDVEMKGGAILHLKGWTMIPNTGATTS